MRQVFMCMTILVIACSDPVRPLELPEAPDDPVPAAQADVVSVTVHLGAPSMRIGESARLIVVARDSERRPLKHVTAVFRSSDDDIVAVSSDGFASALKAGEAQITATVGSISGTLTIPVYEWDDACYGCWDY